MSDKPKVRPGMVCHWCRWNGEGRVIEARYHPVEKAPATPRVDSSTRPPRGVLAVERQGQLI